MIMQTDSSTVYNKRAESFVTLIVSYTDQIEDYEKRNYNECMTCLGFIAALLAAIGTILVVLPSLKNVDEPIVYLAVAFIFMLIPAVITIFMYNFSMNCRRSAILRGYMQFLEEQLNESLCETSMLYHSVLFSDEIVFFPVNRYGPIALAIALLCLFVTCTGWSVGIFLKISPTDSLREYLFGYKVYLVVVLLLCTVCCVLYGIALTRNNDAVKRTRDLCYQLYVDGLKECKEVQILGGLRAQVETRTPKKWTKKIKKSFSKR